MDNRRKDYRHFLLPQLTLPVVLTTGDQDAPRMGITVNLSVGGMALQLPNSSLLSEREPCVVELDVGGGHGPWRISAVVVHRAGLVTPVYGLRFLPLESPAANEMRENVIWRFLLEEQRGTRRRLREAGKNVGQCR